MRTDHRIASGLQVEVSNPLQGFMSLAATAVDAFTVALLITDSDHGSFKVVAYHSLSALFDARVAIPLKSTVIGRMFTGALPIHNAYFDGDSSALGIYSGREPITAYMVSPVGKHGLLWVDTCRAYKFTAKHLKLISELAQTSAQLLELSHVMERNDLILKELELLRCILGGEPGDRTPEGDFFPEVVASLVRLGIADAALIATVKSDAKLCRIISCEGFSPLLKKGRLVRIRQGWIRWSLDKEAPVLISGSSGGERSLTIFHPGETIGFEVRSLAIIPWQGMDDMDHGVLVLANWKPSSHLEAGRKTWSAVAQAIGLAHKTAFQAMVIRKMIKYDGESGQLNEGCFRQEAGKAFSRVRDKKGNLFLLLAQITDMDELYMSLDHETVRSFLAAFTDKLRILTKRAFVMGKFMTGGFGLFIENMPRDEERVLTKNAQSILGAGQLRIDHRYVACTVRIATAAFPDECEDLQSLWEKAMERLRAPLA